MNKFKFITFLLISALGLNACVDLDLQPEGQIMTEDQKKEVVTTLPERLGSDVTAMYSLLGQQFPIYPADERHDDFGYANNCLAADSNGADFVSTHDGYNWYQTPMSYNDRIASYASPYIRWAILYKQIKCANNILLSVPDDTDLQDLLYYKGQALAVRAFDYFTLIQMYQYTYKGNENKLGVPLVLEKMEGDITSIPRATVQQVYDQILLDINNAIELLQGYTRKNKTMVDQNIAYGIRARVNLVMQNYTQAALDAAKARESFSFLTLDEVSVPGFNDLSCTSWMWGIAISPDNISDVYGNWPSKLCSFAGNSYACNVACYKMLNSILWKKIPATDVRKGWWVDEQLKSPILDKLDWPGYEGQPIGPLQIADVKEPYLPYTNVKFGPYLNQIGNGENASDWVIMRAEEMLLIEAEAKAKSGNEADAITLLTNWMKENRDASYEYPAVGTTFENEIWYQRRIELWGEGFAHSDIMRLKRNIVRFTASDVGNFPEKYRWNMSADDGYMLLRIPEAEINSNNGISDADQNNGGNKPLPNAGAGLSDGIN